MSDITLASEITVEEIQHAGDDAMIAHAAMVSTRGGAAHVPDPPEEKISGLIRFLMANRHGTPFEHGSLTVRVHAPIKVWREWHRHRVGWSYNEESGRYKDLEPVFYVPPRERPMIRPDGFKSARPAFDFADKDQYELVRMHLEAGYRTAYLHYQAMLEMGVDRGLARDVLGVGIYSACYCTANPRGIMAFLSLRTYEPGAKFPSRPLHEIEVAARKLETIFASHWPVTHKEFCENGRVAP
jgi:thymidylate synthase (FAD)